MCCTRLAGNTGRKNDAKNRHLRIIAQLCIDNRKQVAHAAIAERPRNACSTSNRKPVNIRLKGYVSRWSMDRQIGE